MIAIRKNMEINYPDRSPYHPKTFYPEYPFGDYFADEENDIYDMLRLIFLDLGYDKENFDTKHWNPLGALVPKNGKVVIKPNWVWDPPYCFEEPGSLSATITHSSLIRAIIDYAYLAVGKHGRISVLDSPIEDTNWNRLHVWNGFSDVMRFFQKATDVPIELLDLRDFTTVHTKFTVPIRNHRLGLAYRKPLRGDPRGYVSFALNDESEFSNFSLKELKLLRSPQKWTGTDVQLYHDSTKHMYIISRTIMEADLIINLPKLKHHKKAGVTLSLKSFVGATNKKQSLPHFKAGFPPSGDEHPYPRAYTQILKSALSNFGIFSLFGLSIDHHTSKKRELPCTSTNNIKSMLKEIRVGDWYGANTLWRTILDLNKVILCGSTDSSISSTWQRNYISIIDGIVGGEGQSPLHPTPKKAGLLLGSQEPVGLDTAATYLMGFNPHKIPTLVHAWQLKQLRNSKNPIWDMDVIINGTHRMTLSTFYEFLKTHSQFITKFKPSIGWKGHIELE